MNCWSLANKCIINGKKTKEMILHFSKRFDKGTIPSLVLDDSIIGRVEEFKLLGVVIRSDLSWCSHVKYMITKASRRIFVVTAMVRSGMNRTDLLIVYSSLVRSVLEYASPVWHCGLSQTQSQEIEKVQRRCFKIIFPSLSYREALIDSGYELLSARRERASRELFEQIKNPLHILNDLLTPRVNNDGCIRTRDSYPYVIPRQKTNRLSKSLIAFGVLRKW